MEFPSVSQNGVAADPPDDIRELLLAFTGHPHPPVLATQSPKGQFLSSFFNLLVLILACYPMA